MTSTTFTENIFLDSNIFMLACTVCAVCVPAGQVEPHVLMAVFQKAKGLQSVGLTPSQARNAILEAADVAGLSLPGVLSPPPSSGAPASSSSRSSLPGSGSGRNFGGPLVPTAHQTSPRQAASTGATQRPSSVPSLALHQMDSHHHTLGNSKKANDLLMVGFSHSDCLMPRDVS